MIMEKISNRAAKTLLKQNMITEELREICSYGIYLLLSSFISFICIMVISYGFHHLVYSVIYITLFSLLRIKIGGFHCSNSISCKLCYCCIYILFEIMFSLNLLRYISIFSMIAYVYIYHTAPSDNKYKKLTLQQYAYLKNQLRILLPIIFLIQFITAFKIKDVSYMISYIVCINAILAYLGKRGVSQNEN